ncbi:retrotransposon protein, putative, ty3-gypsy subclass [Tanacetum coccineum]
MLACFDSIDPFMILECLDVELCVRGSGGYWASMRIESNLMLQIKEAQRDDGELWAIVQNVEDGKHTEFSVDDDGFVWFEDRLCVPNDQVLYEKVMMEAHSSPFTIHPGLTKMYRDLKQYFWWNGMKQDVAFVWTIQDFGRYVRACAFRMDREWDDIFVLVELPYYNVVGHASIKSSTFRALYGRILSSTICWDESRFRHSEELKRFGIKGMASVSRFNWSVEILGSIGEIKTDMSLYEEPESILDSHRESH